MINSSHGLLPQETVQVLLAAGAVIITVRLMGLLIAKLGQPRVVGEIIVGILLGPSVFGAAFPAAMNYLFAPGVIVAFRVLAQFGLVMFMFLVGLELNRGALRGQGRRAVLISQASTALPMLLGVGLGWLLYPRLGGETGRLPFVLFVGVAMSITAFPVLARILQETALITTRLGAVTMACAAIGDVIAWCLLAVIVTVARSGGVVHAAFTIVLAVLFTIGMLTLVRPLFARFGRLPLWVILVVLLLSAWATEQMGVHAIFGAFMAGVVMPAEPGWRLEIFRKVEPIVTNLLLPVFFVVVGLTARIGLLDTAYLWGITALVIVAAVIGKVVGAAVAALLTGESGARATVIGILMNTRGLTELVILTVGLELRVISPMLYTMMVLMALATTFMTMPLLRMFSLLDSITQDKSQNQPVAS
jgi:Kef-type K+ transport system membrane component KefB